MHKTFEIPLDIPNVTIEKTETKRHGDIVIESLLVTTANGSGKHSLPLPPGNPCKEECGDELSNYDYPSYATFPIPSPSGSNGLTIFCREGRSGE